MSHRLGWCLVLLLGLVGCRPAHPGTGHGLPAAPSTPLPSTTPLFSGVPERGYFVTVESALSPAVLLHTDAKELSLFTSVDGAAVRAPRFASFGSNGPKVVTNGVPTDVAAMQERWILLWFLGQPGWEKKDCPWALFLQEPAARMTLDSKGLHLGFTNQAGTIALMPLYGGRLLPGSPEEAVAQGVTREEYKVLPRVWDWSAAVPRDPLTRIRYWSSALVHYPYEAWISSERGTDRSVLHQAFRRLEISTTWSMPPLKLSPIHPSITSMFLTNVAAVTFGEQAYDMVFPTPTGPLWAVPEADHYSFALTTSTESSSLRLGGEEIQASAGGWRPLAFVESLEPAAWEKSRLFQLSDQRSGDAAIGPGVAIPAIEWRGTNRTEAPRILGGLHPGREGFPHLRRTMVNANTRVTYWEKQP